MAILELVLGIFPAIKAIIIAIIPLGFLIFIHELGHFLAAKKSGIKVNTFSIGFGPRIVGYMYKGTEYRLSWLPFGGYVQMEGENPNEQTGAEGEFASASLGKRAFVVIAGPAVNLLFGVLAYWIVFSVGINAGTIGLINGLTGQAIGLDQKGVKIGMMADHSPALAAGVMSDDTIISLNGEAIPNDARFRELVMLNPEKELELVVEREGSLKTLTVVPDAIPDTIGDSDGILHVSFKYDTIVKQIDPDSSAEKAGLIVGDQIESINGQSIYNTPYFGPRIWSDTANWIDEKYRSIYEEINENKDVVTLGVRRDEEKLTFKLPVEWDLKAKVVEKSTAHKAGIRTGDILTTFNGQTVDSKSLYSQIEAAADMPVTLGFIRDGTLRTYTISPEDKSKSDTDGTFYGIIWNNSLSGMLLKRQEIPTQYYSLIGAFNNGVKTSWLTCTAIVRILKKLFEGEVKPNDLAGAVGIATMTNTMFENVGLNSLLFFIGFISINLAIVNLLPIPIADGGHLLFFTLEKIRGRPIPLKAQAIIQQVTVILIIALFIYITWYDGLRLFHSLRN
ncbi:RIP metalloprotease RseP [Candidatus Poribacteria bacterium]|nr:RIP metalloprotease RseP [Candidatus Poribacteria bacterium]MYB63593.1 RIP metalloprotease RseP [Candidatus Poribacteria bacterium]MYF54232.1 RIP metalloprotease RseP [Candidatus Poribacteria bacterium]MYI92782.1 RIP metalloprotease RseP [Candidatus Poribacteria bacterium]